MASIIKEFQVALGFKIDNSTLQSWLRNLTALDAKNKAVEAQTKALGTAAAATAAPLAKAGAGVQNLGKSATVAGAQVVVATTRVQAFSKSVVELSNNLAKGFGFKIDDSQLKSLEDRLTGVAGHFGDFAKSAGEAGVVAAAGMLKVAAANEDLYFAAQRARTSAKGLEAFETGLSRIGIASEETRGAIAGLDQKLLAGGPGMKRWIEQVTGQKADTLPDMMKAAATYMQKHLGKPTEHLARQQVEAWGLPQETIVKMARNPELLAAAWKKADKTIKDVQEPSYKRSVLLKESWDDLLKSLGMFPRFTEAIFGPALQSVLHGAGDLVDGIMGAFNSLPDPIRALIFGTGLLGGVPF